MVSEEMSLATDFYIIGTCQVVAAELGDHCEDPSPEQKIDSKQFCGEEKQAFSVIFDFHQDKMMEVTLVSYESQLSCCRHNITVQRLLDKPITNKGLFISTKAPKMV